MEITSMSNRELYKTLTGYDFPNSNGDNKANNSEKPKSAELNDVQNNGEHIKLFELSAADLERITLSEDKSKIIPKNFDTFVSSVNIDRSQSLKKISSDRFEMKNDIDFNDKYTDMVISTRSLMATCNGGSVPTKESIAKYYGDMAKRLDTAYSEGKFTKEEYEYLNNGIAERMEHAADCAEETAAFFEVSHDRSMSLNSFEKSANMTRDERKADLRAEINSYIEKYFKIDRKSLLAMFNAIRYGK